MREYKINITVHVTAANQFEALEQVHKAMHHSPLTFYGGTVLQEAKFIKMCGRFGLIECPITDNLIKERFHHVRKVA